MKFLVFTLLTISAISKCGNDQKETATETVTVVNEDSLRNELTPEARLLKIRKEEKPLIRIERTFCYGRCPVFTAEIYSNGFLYYNGKANVANIGEFYGTVSEEVISSILER